uniref:Uncharacterized protein n=1 Tax=Anguilla anguilla TaxID=7936 RepID=A0A0E9RB90_ANGAN
MHLILPSQMMRMIHHLLLTFTKIHTSSSCKV